MTDPLEVLNWHETERERSDSQVIAQGRRFQLVEKRLAPAFLTDTERFDFLDEECMGISEKEASDVIPRIVTVTCRYGNITGKGKDWREATDMAFAKWKEENE